MSARFEELAYGATPMGEISLRRRRDPVLDVDVFEVKLRDEYLMSSLFTVAEIELARLGLAAVDGPRQDDTGQDGPAQDDTAPRLDVVVGGLGLGCTARAALDDDRVTSMTVVEALPQVIDWHVRGLLPGAAELTSDPRTVLLEGDFFALAAGDTGFDASVPGRLFDAVLLDIDHTPRHVLREGNEDFYTPTGLRRLARWLRPGGAFALWSDDPPDETFLAVLHEVFDAPVAHVVTFANPLTRGTSANTVYVARRSDPGP